MVVNYTSFLNIQSNTHNYFPEELINVETVITIYYYFQFGSNNWVAQLTSVTCFHVSETRIRVTQVQIINVKF